MKRQYIIYAFRFLNIFSVLGTLLLVLMLFGFIVILPREKYTTLGGTFMVSVGNVKNLYEVCL